MSNNLSSIQKSYFECAKLIYDNIEVYNFLQSLTIQLFNLVESYSEYYKLNKKETIYYLYGNCDSWHGIGRFYVTEINPNQIEIEQFYELIKKKSIDGNIREKCYLIFIICSNVCSKSVSVQKDILYKVPDLLWWLLEIQYKFDNLVKHSVKEEKEQLKNIFHKNNINMRDLKKRINLITNELGGHTFADILKVTNENVSSTVAYSIDKTKKDGIAIKIKYIEPDQSSLCHLQRPSVALYYSLRERMLPVRREKVSKRKFYEQYLNIYKFDENLVPPLSEEEKNYLNAVKAVYWTVAAMNDETNPDHPFTKIAKINGMETFSGISGTALIMLDFCQIFKMLQYPKNRKFLVACLFVFMVYPYPGDHTAHEIFASAEALTALQPLNQEWIKYDPKTPLLDFIKYLLGIQIVKKKK